MSVDCHSGSENLYTDSSVSHSDSECQYTDSSVCVTVTVNVSRLCHSDMDGYNSKSNDEILIMEGRSTPAPGIALETGSSLLVLAAVIVGVLAAITLLFSLALVIDCRNRKPPPSPPAARRRGPLLRFPHFFNNSGANRAAISFANRVCADSGAMDGGC